LQKVSDLIQLLQLVEVPVQAMTAEEEMMAIRDGMVIRALQKP
jgi:hypothetical protein